MPATVFINSNLSNSNLSNLNTGELESQIQDMLAPDPNGNVSFNMNSLSQFLTGATNTLGTVNSNQSKMDKEIKEIRRGYLLLMAGVIILGLCLIITGVILASQGFRNIMPFYYMIIYGIICLIFASYSFLTKSICSINSKFNKMEHTVEKSNSIKIKSNWKDISEICQTNLLELLKDIHNHFEDTELKNFFQNPLKNNQEIDTKYLELLEKTHQIKLNKWKETSQILKTLFAKKYKEFKLLEKTLHDIKTKLSDIKNWCYNTEKILSQYNDREKIKNTVKNYVEKKITDLNYHVQINRYKKTYQELKTILHYLKDNPELENVSKCPVCLTRIRDSFYKQCGHCICQNCIEEQYKIKKKYMCPICRAESKEIGKLFS